MKIRRRRSREFLILGISISWESEDLKDLKILELVTNLELLDIEDVTILERRRSSSRRSEDLRNGMIFDDWKVMGFCDLGIIRIWNLGVLIRYSDIEIVIF